MFSFLPHWAVDQHGLVVGVGVGPDQVEEEERALTSFSSSSKHCLKWELLVFNLKPLPMYLWDLATRQPSSLVYTDSGSSLGSG